MNAMNVNSSEVLLISERIISVMCCSLYKATILKLTRVLQKS